METGDPTATGQQCSLAPGSPAGFGSSDADADVYAAVVNVTDGVVLWSTLLPAATLSEDNKFFTESSIFGPPAPDVAAGTCSSTP